MLISAIGNYDGFNERFDGQVNIYRTERRSLQEKILWVIHLAQEYEFHMDSLTS